MKLDGFVQSGGASAQVAPFGLGLLNTVLAEPALVAFRDSRPDLIGREGL
jgi:hypothetical protein